jgi:serine/threonine protein kinase
MLKEIERLLIAHERTAGFIQTPIFEIAPFESEEHSIPRMEGRRIGAYQVLREIGRGGMGAVYLCSRADDVFHKQVAIKIVRPSVRSAALLRRFRREREILASLDHPNIARLLDGGSTEEGLPYFVMEYVDGVRIDSWCNQKKLNVTERLKLFRYVCAAVQYAHQHLVVHLDLKPSNILVKSDGTVRLLDFGIARLLQPEREEGAPFRTSTSTLQCMTPEYASPEQIKGMPISTTSDVYSLGVVLYGLLTGHQPYRMNSRILHEIVRVICEEDPAQPSTIVTEVEEVAVAEGSDATRLTPEIVSAVREGSPARLKRRLEGDLDNIVLKALQKEPVRRYDSVEQFNDDLGRHLDGLPVRARRDTFIYRMMKFVRRNQAGVAAAVFAAVMLATSIFALLWQERLAIHADRQRLLLPQFVLYSCANLAALGFAVYLSRATLRRLLGTLAGAAAFTFVGSELARVAHSLGWWRYALSDITPLPLTLLELNVLFYAALLALINWRVNRRFGWRGQLIFIGVMGLHGPARDYVGAAATELIIITPGITPFLGWAIFWMCGIAVMQAVMRLVAGDARSDTLARMPGNHTVPES